MTVFAAPDGELALEIVDAGAADGQVRITVDLAPAQYARVDRAGWFHLADGDGFPGPPADATSYRLELRLDDGIAGALLGAVPLDEIEQQLRRELPAALRNTEVWYAEDVQRELPVPPELDGPGVRLAEGYQIDRTRRLLDVAREWLQDRGFEPEAIDDSTVLRLDGDGENGSWVLWVETREDDGIVRVFSAWPHEVPTERRQAVMELITDLNTDLVVGSFELDRVRGQVSLRTGVDLGGDPLTPGIMEGLVRTNVTGFDDHLPRLKAAIDGSDTWVTHTVTAD